MHEAVPSYCDHASEAFKRTVESPLFWIFASVATLGAFTFIAISGAITVPTLLFAAIVGGSCGGLGAFIFSNRAVLFYEFSLLTILALHSLSLWDWWNQIDDDIFLGSLPLATLCHEEHIPRQTGCTAVLSLIEPYESERKTALTTPVTPQMWAQREMAQRSVPMVELAQADPQLIHEAVLFLEEQIALGRSIYVHCKAGVQRSATVVAAHLLKSGKATSLDHALELLFEKRTPISQTRNQFLIRSNVERYIETFPI